MQVHLLLQNFLRCKWNRKFAFFVDGTGHILVIIVRLTIRISLGRSRCPRQEQCNFFCQHIFYCCTYMRYISNGGVVHKPRCLNVARESNKRHTLGARHCKKVVVCTCQIKTLFLLREEKLCISKAGLLDLCFTRMDGRPIETQWLCARGPARCIPPTMYIPSRGRSKLR